MAKISHPCYLCFIILLVSLFLDFSVITYATDSDASIKTCSSDDGTCEEETSKTVESKPIEVEEETIQTIEAESVEKDFKDSQEEIGFMPIRKMKEEIQKYGVAQDVEGTSEERQNTINVIHESIKYMSLLKSRESEEDIMVCRNVHKLCAFWASKGECEVSREYMLENCAPSCQICISKSPEGSMDGTTQKKLLNEIEKYGVSQIIGEVEEEVETALNVIQFSVRYMERLLDIYPEDILLKKCRNKNKSCAFWASLGECQSVKSGQFMETNCGPSCLKCTIKSEDNKAFVPNSEVIEATKEYGVVQEFKDMNKTGTYANILSSLEYMNYIKDKLDITVCRNQNKFCSYWAAIEECEKNKDYMTISCAPSCHVCHLHQKDS